MTLHIAGHDGTDRGDDAVALAALLAPLYDAELLAVHVILLPSMRDRYAMAVIERLETEADDVLERARGVLGDLPGSSARATFASSPAAGLQQMCADEGAAVAVVGSTHRGPIGRVVAGSTAERLLTGAPCPVALAPRGFAGSDRRLEGVVVGYDGGEESKAAVDVAADLARRTGVGLRVVTVMEPPSAYTTPLTMEMRDSIEASMRRRAAHLAAEGAERAQSSVTAQAVIAEGDPGVALVTASRDGADLVVIGSRRYGPARSVLVGSVGHHMAHGATCPVLIVPRGVETDRAGELLGAAGAR